MSLRIGSGRWRRRLINTPVGANTRPTLARVRESLLTSLEPWLGGGSVLDLFCGGGALGIEAMSRGAVHATFVEQARPALDTLDANLALLGAQEEARVVAADATVWCAREFAPGEPPFDAIMLDPPYGLGLADAILKILAGRPGEWLTPTGRIAAQVGRKDGLAAAYGSWVQCKTKTYGETRIDFYEWRR